MEPLKILLFISKESAVYNFTRRQVESACANALDGKGAVLEVVDIAENPEMAERYNIEALPTLIVGTRRYIGAPTAEVLNTCLGLNEEAGK